MCPMQSKRVVLRDAIREGEKLHLSELGTRTGSVSSVIQCLDVNASYTKRHTAIWGGFFTLLSITKDSEVLRVTRSDFKKKCTLIVFGLWNCPLGGGTAQRLLLLHNYLFNTMESFL